MGRRRVARDNRSFEPTGSSPRSTAETVAAALREHVLALPAQLRRRRPEVHDGPTLVARALPSPPADLVPPTTVIADAAARAAASAMTVVGGTRSAGGEGRARATSVGPS